jgi:N6-adenosine-specific RNA methylase IME4
LYLWLTDSFAPYAYRIVRDWGFTDKTMLTWFKSKRPSGSFDYFRPRTERILFAVKGDFRVPGWRARADDWFEAPIPRKGAGRPKEFYELVEQASPGPYLEIYGRLPRDGWAARWVIDDAQVVDVV